MPVFKIHHITRYVYDRPVKESVNEIRIYPYSSPDQEVLEHDLNITGQPDLHCFRLLAEQDRRFHGCLAAHGTGHRKQTRRAHQQSARTPT